MRRPWSLLAALILSVPVRAQVRTVAPTVLPGYAVPGFGFGASALAPLFVSPSVSIAPLLSAPALSAAPLSAPSALTAAAPSAPVPVTAPLPGGAAAPPFAAAAGLPAAADGPRPGRSLPSAAPASALGAAGGFTDSLVFGAKLFDGSVEVRSAAGDVFTPTRYQHPAVPGVTFLLKSRPAAVPARKSYEGLNGAALLDQASAAAKRGHAGGADYRLASHYLFGTADHVEIGGVGGVVDAYSGVFVPGKSEIGSDYPEKGDQDGDGFPDRGGMNVEHVWPQSLFRRGMPMRSDLHHLMTTFEHPNGMRGNLPFGVVKGAPDYHNGAGAKRGGGVFEPPDSAKGRVARALLYFYARYRDEDFFGSRSAQFWNQQIPAILEWNRRFPPDEAEKRRNDLVEKWQGNRNPFIDDPSLADRIGAEALAAHGSAAAKSLAPQKERRRGETYGIAARGFTHLAEEAPAPVAPKRRSDTPRKGKKRESRQPHRPRGRGHGRRG